jgi:hypothetical protein
MLSDSFLDEKSGNIAPPVTKSITTMNKVGKVNDEGIADLGKLLKPSGLSRTHRT